MAPGRHSSSHRPGTGFVYRNRHSLSGERGRRRINTSAAPEPPPDQPAAPPPGQPPGPRIAVINPDLSKFPVGLSSDGAVANGQLHRYRLTVPLAARVDDGATVRVQQPDREDIILAIHIEDGVSLTPPLLNGTTRRIGDIT